MRNDKENAIKMRKQGKSYGEIRESLKIPKSTLSGWFTDQEWSQDIKKRLTDSARKELTVAMGEMNRVRGNRLKRAYEGARDEARKEFETLKYSPVFIAGMMLYWGEGDKLTRQHVKLTNTDPEMVKLYVLFLTSVLRIPKTRIRLHLLLYPDLDDWLCQVYWSNASGLSRGHFTKSTVIQGKHKTRRLSFGVCIVNISSTYLKVKILEWLKLLPGELMNRGYYENIAR